MKRTAAALVAAAALLVAGCAGDDDKNAYVNAVNRVSDTYSASVARIGAEIDRSTPPRQIASSLERQAGVLDRGAEQLAAIDPPSDARAGHAKLVGGMRLRATELRTAARSARRGDVQEAVETLTDSRGVREYQEGLRQLERDAGIRGPT